MNPLTIRYGGKQLSLAKSDQLVAIKAAVGREKEVARTVQNHRGVCTGQMLNGFEVANLSASPKTMEDTLDEIRRDPGISVGTHVYHTSNDGVPFVPTGELYLEFQENTPIRECQKLIDQYFLEVVQTRGERSGMFRITEKSPNPLKVAAALQQLAQVAVAEPELATPGRLMAFVLPTDGLLKNQWHLRNTGEIDGSSLGLKAGADSRAVDAWEAAESLGSRDVIVGVIDDGFDLDHPDLSGPGKVVAPWDFTRNSDKPRPGTPFWNPSDQEWVGDWHGTACAGVAVGDAQGSGIVGSAPNCRLMPVRWGINLADSQIEAWFDHVRTQGAWVVSCSWGAAAAVFPLSTRATNAIARCAQEGRNGLGSVICFAAGNENTDIDAPDGSSLCGFAIHPDVIAVAACTSRDERSHYSCFGDAISICAPSSGSGGRRVWTSDVMGTFIGGGQVIEAGYSPGEYTNSFGGTSSSTPLVAGICALILSLRPSLTAVEVKALIEKTARRIGSASSYDSNGHSRDFGFGCIDAKAAVEELLASHPNPASASKAKPSRASSTKSRRTAKARS